MIVQTAGMKVPVVVIKSVDVSPSSSEKKKIPKEVEEKEKGLKEEVEGEGDLVHEKVMQVKVEEVEEGCPSASPC